MALEEKQKKYRGRKAVPPQYRRKRPVKKILLILLAVVLALLAVLAGLYFWQKSQKEPDNQTTTPPPPDRVIHLVAGGDVNVTDKTVAAGLKEGGYDYTEVFRDVLPVLSAGDVTVLNFEGVLSGSTYGSETKAAPAELLKALTAAGVDVLQTANSYSIYDSLRGLNATLQGVQAAGMTPLGTYASNADFDRSGGYIIWEVQGIKVAMMAFTKGMNGKPLPSGSENCVNLLYDDYYYSTYQDDYYNTYQKVNTDGITQIVRNAAAHQPDVMIALVHWGSEFNDQISKSQKKICAILQEEGVDAIIGTHPHYVHKMEYDADTGNFIAWSLGDFYGDGETAGTNYSVLLDLEITKDGATGQTKVTDFSYVPIYLERGEDGSLRVLRIREAMAAYENRYLNRVSEATYQAMQSALSRIESRING